MQPTAATPSSLAYISTSTKHDTLRLHIFLTSLMLSLQQHNDNIDKQHGAQAMAGLCNIHMSLPRYKILFTASYTYIQESSQLHPECIYLVEKKTHTGMLCTAATAF